MNFSRCIFFEYLLFSKQNSNVIQHIVTQLSKFIKKKKIKILVHFFPGKTTERKTCKIKNYARPIIEQNELGIWGVSGTHDRVVRVGVRVGHAETFRSIHDWKIGGFFEKRRGEKGRDFRVSFQKKKKIVLLVQALC